ncbi:MAG TPA: hypothetical protein VHT52_15815 [Stellaceae bacterium]|nr:hypothetical protein [Stellaceae bacterium]
MARPAAEGSAALPGITGGLMEAIVARDNLKKALAQVKRNKGAPGVDGMTVEKLTPYLKEHWPAIRAQLLDGTYRPQPVRRVETPKPAGGTRALGIPSLPRRRCSVPQDWRDGARLWQAVCWLREQLMSADGEKRWGQQC